MANSRPVILVCDDEAPIRAIVSSKLRGCGFVVHEARHGLEGYCLVDHGALAQGALPRTPEPIVPDAVVTDLQMPHMSGFDLAMKLKEFGATSEVPVLMLTARGYILEPNQMSKTNIRRLMPKPFGAGQLLEQVVAMLGLSPQRVAELKALGQTVAKSEKDAA
jgi:CheY-like chemotaxis protein